MRLIQIHNYTVAFAIIECCGRIDVQLPTTTTTTTTDVFSPFVLEFILAFASTIILSLKSAKSRDFFSFVVISLNNNNNQSSTERWSEWTQWKLRLYLVRMAMLARREVRATITKIGLLLLLMVVAFGCWVCITTRDFWLPANLTQYDLFFFYCFRFHSILDLLPHIIQNE